MKSIVKTIAATAVGACIVLGNTALWAAEATKKNWTPPQHKIYGQKLSDDTMATHPELLSVTLHGVPPGAENVYTMFAGSFPERIGNPDDPDDIDVTKKGITILDPRWHRTNDKDKKFVVLMPLRDASGGNVGLIVYAFKDPVNPNTSASEKDHFGKAAVLRDDLAKKIPSYKALFDPAK